MRTNKTQIKKNSKTLVELTSEIESLVRRRRPTLAFRLMKNFLAEGRKKQSHLRMQAADWHRRLGRPASGLKVLQKENFTRGEPDSDLQTEQIAVARLLNLMGASRYSLRILEKTDLEHAPLHSRNVAGHIYLSNYQYSSAHKIFKKCLNEMKREQDPYRYDLLRVSYADSLAGLSHFDQAIEQVKTLFESTTEPQMKVVAGSAWGEYLFRKGSVQESKNIFRKISDYLNPSDLTPDAGILHKWLGAVLIQEGEFEFAKEHLEKALKILCVPGAKPEGWLEVLYYLSKIDLSTETVIMTFPSHHFPKKNEIHMTDFSPSNEGVEERIDLGSRVHWFQDRTEIPMTKTSEVLGILSLAGHFGVPKYRLIETLWPEELFDMKNLEDRLHQLLRQLRSNGAVIRFSENHLWLEKTKTTFQVAWSSDVLIGKSFIKTHTEFNRRDVENYFKIKKTKAAEIIRSWLECQAITHIQGRRYQSTNRRPG